MAAASKTNGDDVQIAAAVQLLDRGSLSKADIEPLPMNLLREMQSDPNAKLVLEPEVVPMKFIHSAADTITTLAEVQQMAAFHDYSDNEICVLRESRSRAPMCEQDVKDQLHSIILEFVDEF
jgi:hypothetical protein